MTAFLSGSWRTAAALLLCASASLAQQNPLALRARDILVERCGRCHASSLEKPEGDFGFVDDLVRLKSEWIAAGPPEATELWSVIVDSPMPPEGQPESPLPAEDLATLKAWIAAGAPDLANPAAPLPGQSDASSSTAPGADAQLKDAPAQDEATAPRQKAPIKTPLEFHGAFKLAQGRLHVLLVHFPIALLVAAFFAEFFALCRPKERRQGLRQTMLFCLRLGALFAILATWTGWVAVETEGYAENKVGLHRWLGVATTALALLLALCADLLPVRLRFALLLLATLLVSATGHLGGELVHGARHFGDLFPR